MSTRAHKNRRVEEERVTHKIPNRLKFTASTKNSKGCSVFSLIQYGLLASIGVTRSSSSRPFLCTAEYDASSSKLASPSEK